MPNKNTAFYESIKSRYSVKSSLLRVFELRHRIFHNRRQSQLSPIKYYDRFHSDSSMELQSLLSTDRSLYSLTEALWRVYHSNNLQLRHSFVNLIRSVAEQSFQLREMTRETKTFYRSSRELQAQIVNRVNRVYGALLIKRELLNTIGYSGYLKAQHVKKIDFRKLNKINEVRQIVAYKQKSINSQMRDSLGTFSILEKIYEGIESNYLFYNNSAYSSVRTLYRLTNSLWKVYNSQNLELSRNFTRLITQITERNTVTSVHRKPQNMFKTTQSLYSLVDALRQAFSGNNLHLRQSLVGLVSDIHHAGKTTVKREHHRRNYFVLFQHRRRNGHSTTPENALDTSIVHEIIGEELKSFERRLQKPHTEISPNTEAIISTVLSRVKEEQAEQWRFEKLQRGIL